MANKIIIDPEVLLSQSSAMTKLKNDYEDLFSNITKTLNDTNGNWSDNLAHNFAGKINSAQKSFSMVVSELEKGAIAAKNSADTMQNIDTELSRQITGDNGDSKKTVKKDSSSTSKSKKKKGKKIEVQTKEEILKEGYEALPENIRKYLESRGADLHNLDKWLDENYDTLPKPIRDAIESKLPDKVKDIITITREIAGGEADYDTLLKITTLAGGKVDGAALYGCARATLEGIDEFNYTEAYYTQIASEQFKNGDVLGGVLTCATGAAVMTGNEIKNIGKSIFYTAEGLVKNFGLDDPMTWVSGAPQVDGTIKIASAAANTVQTFIGSLFK